MENQTVFVEEINFKELQFLEVISFPYPVFFFKMTRDLPADQDPKAGLKQDLVPR